MQRVVVVLVCALGVVGSARAETPAFDFVAARERGERALAKRAHKEVIAIYSELVMLAPRSSLACVWQGHVARAWLALPTATRFQRTQAVGYLSLLYQTMHDRNDLPSYEDGECKRAVATLARELATSRDVLLAE